MGSANVALGVLFHWLGGLASGSFYVPYKAVRKWSWEVYWLAGGFFSWIIAPWLIAYCILHGTLFDVISEGFKNDSSRMLLAYVFGCLWGIGGLTFGLTMRYLGMSLGMAIALGYCTVLGTIMEDTVKGVFIEKLCTQPPYVVIILGLGVCLLGVVLAGVAGMSKEREMDEETKKESVKEFNFGLGLLVATISGVFSACMAFGLSAADPLAVAAQAAGVKAIWTGLPKLCIVLLGGFTTNFLWCAYLLAKNKTAYQFTSATVNDATAPEGKARVNRVWNYFFSALAGTTWYFQFFFYTMGESQMGEYTFSSWTLHMASIIIFSSIWGLALHEWRGSSKFTKFILGVAIFTLLYSTITVGYGNYMKQQLEKNNTQPAVQATEEIDVIVEPQATESSEATEATEAPAEQSFYLPMENYRVANVANSLTCAFHLAS